MSRPGKHWPQALAALLLLALGLWAQASGDDREPGPPPRRELPPATDTSLQNARVIVKYTADSGLMRRAATGRTSPTKPLHALAMGQRLGLTLSDGRILGPRTQALHTRGISSARLAAQLSAQADVEWAVPDGRRYASAATNDPFLGGGQTVITPAVGQWYLRAPDQTAVSAINAVNAWDISPGRSNVTVAVLDTGVRNHPELVNKMRPGYDFVHDTSTANDGDGRDTDANDPGDGAAQNFCFQGDPASDSSWHGTQVAGLIGAQTNDAVGMAGVGRDVMLLPLRVLGRCGGFDSDIIAAMRWAAGLTSEVGFGTSLSVVNNHPARVINMSLGHSGSCPTSYAEVIAELNAAGVSVVVAAGNGNGLAVDAPANCAGAIAVAGLRHIGSKVAYSSVGPEVAVAAPAGNCVNLTGPCLFPLLTTINSGTLTPGNNTYSDSFNPSLGTSFAAPLVAGTVGLMVSANPALTAAQVRAILQSSARPFVTSGAESSVAACLAPTSSSQPECYCTTSTCGAGMLDAAQALAQAIIPVAAITASSSTPTVGAIVTLDGSGSVALPGRSIAVHQWRITTGSALASFTGASNAAMASLLANAVGSVVVELSVTDSAGAMGRASTTLTISTTPPPADSGGGAMDGAWLLGLVGVLALALRRERR